MQEIQKVLKEMNRLGQQAVPFLFLIDFEKKYGYANALDDLPDEIQFQINKSNSTCSSDFYLNKYPISFKSYTEMFENVQKGFHNGLSSYLNLTASTPIETNLDLAEIYKYSQAKYKILWANKFTSFSPETFIQIKNDNVYCFPMKGTIKASEKNAAETVLKDPKELEEHTQAVHLVEDELKKVADSVAVKRFRYIEKVKTHQGELLQVCSEIKGKLTPHYQNNLGNLFDALLPAVSICGAPKEESMELLKTVEQHKRKFYTGVFGVFDGVELDSAVLIRFVEQTENDLIFKSGGGITKKSDAKAEYQEMLSKVYVPIN